MAIPKEPYGFVTEELWKQVFGYNPLTEGNATNPLPIKYPDKVKIPKTDPASGTVQDDPHQERFVYTKLWPTEG